MVTLSIVPLLYVPLAWALDPEPQFFAMLQDVPLMPGIAEINEDAFLFDKPEGGIQQSSAFMSDVSKQKLVSFYAQVLPEFGWNVTNDGRYFREGEILELSFEKDVVTILVRPTR